MPRIRRLALLAAFVAALGGCCLMECPGQRGSACGTACPPTSWVAYAK
jgi:hypothetical protein